MATDDDPESDDKKMPLLDHLIELRSRLLRAVIALFVAFGICFYFAEPLYAFLVQPLAEILTEKGLDRRMIYTALTEVFFTYVKVAFFFPTSNRVTCLATPPRPSSTRRYAEYCPGVAGSFHCAVAPAGVSVPLPRMSFH